MKKLLFAIAIILFSLSAYAETVNITFVWDRNTEEDLAGYMLYESEVSGDYSAVTPIEIMGNPNSYTLQTEMESLITKYFVLTAFDTSGNESGYSNQVSHVIYIDTNAPRAPMIFHIKNYVIIN